MNRDKKIQEKVTDSRFECKTFHITIVQIPQALYDKDYWVNKAQTFKPNLTASIVALETGMDSRKGMHVHILIQFSTKYKLSRKQFSDHFCADCVNDLTNINIKTKPSKTSLITAICYLHKTLIQENIATFGSFTYRQEIIPDDIADLQFLSEVRNKRSAIKYFKKIIDETENSWNIIEHISKTKTERGDYLLEYPVLRNELIKFEHAYRSNKLRSAKQRIVKFADFLQNNNSLRETYVKYLDEFPTIFKQHMVDQSDIVLEEDYDQHIEEDLRCIDVILKLLKIVIQYRHHRPHKSINLYLWSSKPSFGKTRFLTMLQKYFIVYRLPDDGFYLDYQNCVFDIIISDEAKKFIGSKSLSHLKTLLAGEATEFDRKHKDKVLKEDNPLVVLAENIDLDVIMKRHKDKASYSYCVLRSRIISLEIKSRALLHFIIDKCIL